MGEVFDNLCTGPVVVIDNGIGRGDKIDTLIKNIESNGLCVIKITSLDEARHKVQSLSHTNFILLDWLMFDELDEMPIGVVGGSTKETENEQEMVEFITHLRERTISPIFILTAYDVDTIHEILLEKKIVTEQDNNIIFIENKSNLFLDPTLIINKIEEWIQSSSHVYFSMWWLNELLRNNSSVFWDLYKLDSQWPSLLYSSLKIDTKEPLLLVTQLFPNIIFSEFNYNLFSKDKIDNAPETINSNQINSLKNIYRRIMFTDKEIEKSIVPGDIYKVNNRYFINIRPECDTTSRADQEDGNIDLYLLRGKKAERRNITCDPKYGILEKEDQLVLLFLDRKNAVVFNKKELIIKKYHEIKEKKICRLVPPYITRMQHSYSSYIGRYGVPSFHKDILHEMYPPKELQYKSPNDNEKATGQAAELEPAKALPSTTLK